jgi:peptidoglycan/xylan/chitin deacetylase (PgdA/CDA1 family)
MLNHHSARKVARFCGWTPVLLLILWLGAAFPVTAQEEAPPPDKVIYLTFDDGPSGYTQPILDVLARYDAKATFFVLGRAAASQPELVEAIYAAGHGLGNHTYNHPSLPGVGWQRMADEVAGTANALGGRDSGCLRPPYGARSAAVAGNAGKLGYQLVLWSIDPRDWARPGARAIAERVISRAHPNGVVVMHDGGGDRSQTVAALEIILPALRDQGYRFAAMCRDGVMPPAQKQAPPPMPPGSAPILAGGAPLDAVAAAGEPQPVLGVGALTSPAAGATVRGQTPVLGIATHPAFRKWQLDLILEGGGETFLAVGEIQAPVAAELAVWDTTLYPNGSHQLRLRVVHEGLNYDEYFLPVTVANAAAP